MDLSAIPGTLGMVIAFVMAVLTYKETREIEQNDQVFTITRIHKVLFEGRRSDLEGATSDVNTPATSIGTKARASRSQELQPTRQIK